jgi:hypothetical protein
MPNPPPVPPPTAEQRKNQKTDVKRKEGTALRQAAGVAKPAPQNSTSDAIPQMAAPPPATSETSPTFTPAQYKAPNKGLEYLALGIGMLFPGAPIAKLAAGFAGGLNQGAQQGYERNEQQAEQKYKVASEDARTKAVNDQAARQAILDKQNTDFQNARLTYELQTKPMRENGIDPKTNKPFVVPPQLAAPLPPVASAAQRYQRENQLAAFYQSVGATNQADAHAAAAKGYAEDARAATTAAAAMQRTALTINAANQRFILGQQGENSRLEERLGTEVALHNDTEYNTNMRFAVEQRDKLRKDVVAQSRAVSEASAATGKFAQTWRSLTAEPVYKKDSTGNIVKDSNGQPVIEKSAPISDPKMKAALVQQFKAIDKSQDPADLANWLAGKLGDPSDPSVSAAQQLIIERGNVANLNAMAGGRLIVKLPQSYFDHLDQVGAAQQKQFEAHLFKVAGLNRQDPNVARYVKQLTDAGVPLDETSVATIRKNIMDDAAAAKAHEPIFPGGQSAFQSVFGRH